MSIRIRGPKLKKGNSRLFHVVVVPPKKKGQVGRRVWEYQIRAWNENDALGAPIEQIQCVAEYEGKTVDFSEYRFFVGPGTMDLEAASILSGKEGVWSQKKLEGMLNSKSTTASKLRHVKVNVVEPKWASNKTALRGARSKSEPARKT